MACIGALRSEHLEQKTGERRLEIEPPPPLLIHGDKKPAKQRGKGEIYEIGN